MSRRRHLHRDPRPRHLWPTRTLMIALIAAVVSSLVSYFQF